MSILSYFPIRFLFISLLLFGFCHNSASAQKEVGVVWEPPQNIESANIQLQQFHNLGITVLEINTAPPDAVWKQIDSLQFDVYGNLDIQFPTKTTFANPDSTLIKRIEQKTQRYLSHSSVSAIGLFNHGAIHNPAFWTAINPYIKELQKVAQATLYYHTHKAKNSDSPQPLTLVRDIQVKASNLNSLNLSDNSTSIFLYKPSGEFQAFLYPFKEFIEAVPESTQTILIHSDWLMRMLEIHPQMEKIITSISSKSDPVFPLPEEKHPESGKSLLPLFLLLIIWGTVGLHYNISPLYRKSLFRYFTSHKFFVNDIFERHIRSPVTAIVILIQNILLVAASMYAAFTSIFSELGQNALFYHFAPLAIAGQSPLSIFVWTTILLSILSIVGILWLYFCHKKINSITQVTIIFSWPLHFNLLLGTVAITAFSANQPLTVIFFAVLALVLSCLSFIPTSLDMARFTHRKFKFFAKTIIPYSLLLIVLSGWILTQEKWMEVLDLAFALGIT